MRKYYLEFSKSIFSKNYNLRYFVVGNVARKSRCFRGKKYRFRGWWGVGGGGE
jgi:hypothetical protein